MPPGLRQWTGDTRATLSITHKLCIGWFAANLLAATAVLAGACHVLRLSSSERAQRVARALARLCWRWPFALCPWIRVTFAAGRDDLARLGIGSSVWLIANHVSFLDTVLFAAFVPPTTLARFQCLADARLFKLPLLGTVLKACGNIPVYFAKPESSGFSTDKARSEETAARLETSVGRGGSIAVYPEGQMNRADPASLQPFRHGGFRVPLRHDMAIYAWVAAGNAECWPRNVAIGGMPADIRVALLPVAPAGTRSFLREALLSGRASDDDGEAAAAVSVLCAARSDDAEVAEAVARGAPALSRLCQTVMQDALTALNSDRAQ